jgi:ribosomal-protein-alanine N-acetyltransferase
LMPYHLMQAIKFRPMQIEDIPSVHAIDLLSFTMPWPEKSYHFELTQNPSTLAVVAELNQQNTGPAVIGMAVVWMILDEAHIATIAIHPDFRGVGLGKSLLAETLRLRCVKVILLPRGCTATSDSRLLVVGRIIMQIKMRMQF